VSTAALDPPAGGRILDQVLDEVGDIGSLSACTLPKRLRFFATSVAKKSRLVPPAGS